MRAIISSVVSELLLYDAERDPLAIAKFLVVCLWSHLTLCILC